MSIQATAWVLEHSRSRLAARLVLIAISHRVSNETGEAWPSVETIAKEACVSKRSAQLAFQKLRELGELEVIEADSRYGTNTYRLVGFVRDRGVKNQVSGVQSSHPQGCNLRQRGVKNTASRGAILDKNDACIYIEPKEENLKEEPKSNYVSSERKNSAAEPSALFPPVVLIPLVDGSDYPVSGEQARRWQESFPAVDVAQELREIRQWNATPGNPKKTRSGVERHIVKWLMREQDKGRGGTNGSSKHQQRERNTLEAIRAVKQRHDTGASGDLRLALPPRSQ